MSGISGRLGEFGFAKQSGKGVAAAAPALRLFAAGQPSLHPLKERGRFAMTDTGRDLQPGFTSRMGVEGDLPLYFHPDAAASLLAYALGANADTGTTPNFTHTITPAGDGMWVTIWRIVGGVVIEKFTDCKISTLRIESAAGAAALMSVGVVGITYEFLAVAPIFTDTSPESPYLHAEAKDLINLGGAIIHPTSLVWELNNNMSVYQADDYKPADVDPGGREISLSASIRFGQQGARIEEYREFYYGSSGGTTMSPTVGTKAFDATWRRNANLEAKIAHDQVTYAAVPVQPDPGGEPIGVELAMQVEKPAGVIVTATVKDQLASIT